MKFNLRTLWISLAALVGILVLAIGLFVAFFPKDLAAQEAERRIEEATGRDLTLGSVELSFWPALGFSAEQASLSNPEGFPTDQPFLAADRIVFAVKLLPLLRGAVEVKRLIFEGAELNLRANQDQTDNWTFPTEQSESQPATIEDLRLEDVRLVDGRISFQGAEGEPLVLSDVDASLTLQSLDQPATLEAALTYRDERLEVQSAIANPRAVMENAETPLTASVESEVLNAAFDGAFNAANGALTGALEASGPSLRRVLSWNGTPMGEGGGFGAFRVQGQMAHLAQETALTDLALRLDTIDANGALTLITQEGGKLLIRGALNAASIDLNTYLPAPPEGAQASGVQANTAWDTTAIDLTGLRAFDADIAFTLGALRFQRMSFTDAAMALRVNNGVADARLSRLSLYEGAGTARFIADASGSTPRIAVQMDAQNIQAEPLLRDAVGFDRIAGRGRLRASLVGTGASQAAIMRSLRGDAAFVFNDGQLKGVNLAQVARTVQAAMTGQAAGEGSATDFAEMAADFTVAGGVAATDNLRLLNPFVRLEGRGVIDVGQQSIDMRITPRAVSSSRGQGGDLSVAGIGVPFRIRGPWTRVGFSVALEDVAQDQLRNILGQRGGGLGDIGAALGIGGAAPPAPAGEAGEGEDATQPAQPAPSLEDRARDALGGILGGNRDKNAPGP
jgi:AsmA protein